MKTDDLINQLGEQAKPVKPLRSPLMRAMLWLFMLGICMLIGIVIVGLRPDFYDMMMHPVFILEMVSLLIAGIFAIIATFQLSIPCEKVYPSTWALLGVSSLLLFTRMVICFIYATPEGIAAYASSLIGMPVIGKSLVISALPAGVLFWLIKKGAPVRIGLTAIAALLALASFAAMGCRSICPMNDPAYIFIWHGLPLMILIIIGLLVGRSALRW